MNTRWSLPENTYVATDAQLRFLFADRHFYADAEVLQKNQPGLTVFGMDLEAPQEFKTLQGLIDLGHIADEFEPAGSSLAGVYYTGGTTGLSKGVMLSHNALWINAVSVAMAIGIREVDRLLHAAPIFHLAGGGMALGGVVNGSSHVFMPRFVASEVIANVERFGVTKMVLVPTMIQMMLDDPGYGPGRLASLDAFCFGGAPIPDLLLGQLKQDLPKVSLFHTYGQTEMGPTLSYLEARWQYVGSPKGLSVGTPFAAVEAKVVDENGALVPAGVPGEIWARGPGQMDGYLNKPEETANTITEDGWVRTGDIAYQDQDGYLYICDRAKDMIVSGGENVFSGEVENALLAHPAVREAAVIAVPDKDYGEAVHAVLVLHEGRTMDLGTLRNHCKERIAGYKCPRSFELRESMPLSAAGKVLKRELRDPYWKTTVD
jgi:long-chain acyl-CoA synthetase